MLCSLFLRSYRHIVVAVPGRIAEKCQLSWLRLIWRWRCDQSNKNRKHISIVSVIFGDDSPRESDQLICGSFIACKSRTNTKFIHFSVLGLAHCVSVCEFFVVVCVAFDRFVFVRMWSTERRRCRRRSRRRWEKTVTSSNFWFLLL